jgi:hypothetical protein
MTHKQLQEFFNSGGILPEADIHPTYKAGSPLLADDVATELGTAIESLMNHYMDDIKKSESNRAPGLMARFFLENFHHGSEAQLFIVGWEDLYDLLNIDAFDVCLLRNISL